MPFDDAHGTVLLQSLRAMDCSSPSESKSVRTAHGTAIAENFARRPVRCCSDLEKLERNANGDEETAAD